jgi:hypothetical protein
VRRTGWKIKLLSDLWEKESLQNPSNRQARKERKENLKLGALGGLRGSFVPTEISQKPGENRK